MVSCQLPVARDLRLGKVAAAVAVAGKKRRELNRQDAKDAKGGAVSCGGKAAEAPHFAYYNFVRIHRALRVTPAMEAGVTSRLWEIQDLLN